MISLSPTDANALFDMPNLAEAFKQAFREQSQYLKEPTGSMFQPSFVLAYLKKAQDQVQLIDNVTHQPLINIEASYLCQTARAVVAAIATHELAAPSAKKLALIGASEDAKTCLALLSKLRQITELRVFDANAFATGVFCAHIARDLGITCVAESRLSDALFEAEIIITSMPNDLPYLFQGMLPETSHVTSLMTTTTVEFSQDLLLEAQVFCDDKIAITYKGLLAKTGLDQLGIKADLAEVFSGIVKRTNELSIYTAGGLDWQDLLVAWHLYQLNTAT